VRDKLLSVKRKLFGLNCLDLSSLLKRSRPLLEPLRNTLANSNPRKQYPAGVKFAFGTLDLTLYVALMPAVHHVCRLANVQDIRKSAPLWGQDRSLFDTDVWISLPTLLEELLRNQLVRLIYIESLPSCEPRLLGGISFINPGYADEAHVKGSTLPNVVFRAVLENRTPFLSPKDIGKINARGELHLMNFFGNFSDLDLSQLEMANFYEVSNHGYHFFHFGYAYRALWADVSAAHHVQELQNQGMQILRVLTLPAGHTSTLMCLTRDVAQANPYLRRSGFFFPPKPRFKFSLGEQALLELSMLDIPDDHIVASLHVSTDAIKKRWRSIYAKVDSADPELLTHMNSGTEQRRALLSYMRMHLEEIRPYDSTEQAVGM